MRIHVVPVLLMAFPRNIVTTKAFSEVKLMKSFFSEVAKRSPVSEFKVKLVTDSNVKFSSILKSLKEGSIGGVYQRNL